MKKFLAEFIGTFFLVFTIGMTVLSPGAGNLAPFAIAAALMVMIYACAHLSGAHFNPAVTVALWIRGHCRAAEIAPYVASQIAAALAAALCVRALKVDLVTETLSLAEPIALRPAPALLAEFLFTFALAWVVLNVATHRGVSGNFFYGIAIAATVLAGALAVGGISGAIFNPAVAIGVCTMKIVSWSSLWIFLVADFLGGIGAALAFRFVNEHD